MILTPPIGSFLRIFSIFIRLFEFASQKYIRLSIFISYFFSLILTSFAIFLISLISLVKLTLTRLLFVFILYIYQKDFSNHALLTLTYSASSTVKLSSFVFDKNFKFQIYLGLCSFPEVISLNYASTFLFVSSI